jgi:flavin-dependent dehydrogenase
MDVGTVRIEPTRREKRIAAVHRGAGPRGVVETRWHSFDAHLLDLAKGRGAQVLSERVEGIDRDGGKPRITTKKGTSPGYDLLVGAVGVNTAALKLFEEIGAGYRAPGTTKTYICELFLGERTIKTYFGNAMHMFLLNLPRLEFAALIPKGEHVTMVMLGTGIDHSLVDAFFSATEVRKCFPPGWSPPPDFCRCSPAINISAAVKPFADRMVLIGDSGVSRLYKDGIGGAYRTAKAAARTAVFAGVAEEDFRKGYLPVCRSLAADNRIGKVVFGITGLIQKTTVLRKGLLRMTTAEQESRQRNPRMSDVLWDTFTGSAPYKDVFRRSVHPVFLGRLFYETLMGALPSSREGRKKEDKVPFGKTG